MHRSVHAGVQLGMNWRPGPYRIHAHAAHDINRDVVHVAAIYEQVSLVVDRGNHAYNGHASSDQPPQGPLVVHTGLPLAQVGCIAEVAACTTVMSE